MFLQRPPGSVPSATGRARSPAPKAVGSAMALTVLLVSPVASASRFAGPGDDTLLRVGSLNVSETRRRRIRGGRPDGAPLDLAWAAPAHNPGRDEAAALAGFERAAFPADPAAAAAKTLIDAPPDAWMRALTLPDIPVRWNTRTIEYLRYFRDDPKGRALIKGWMRRAGRYAAKMASVFVEAKVPGSLVMVAMAESGFNPTARSRVGAAGAWQFMPGTAEAYGLHSSFWTDDRYDVEKSTLAAALYLKDLRVRFGSWELALAAYNAGYGLVMTTIRRHNTNDYWGLCEIESGLPYATTNYVPKIIAAALVRANPEAFGVDPPAIDPLPAADWVDVRVQRSTSLDVLARLLDVDADLLLELNAQLLRRRTPPTEAVYRVRVPRESADRFTTARAELLKRWTQETTHLVRTGETLQAIAHTHHTTTRALRRLNGIRDSAEVRGGVTLVVPSHREAAGTAPAAEPAGQRPLAAVVAVSPPKGHRLVFFEATRATTPRTVERAFGVPWSDVVTWNGLDPQARLQAHQVLQMVVPNAFDPVDRGVIAHELHEVEYVVRGSRAHLDAALRRRGKVRRGYRVRSGDSLAKIGRRFNLTTGDLARVNAFSRRHEPRPGATIVVYVDRGKTAGTVAAPPPQKTPGLDVPVAPARRRPSTPTTARRPGDP